MSVSWRESEVTPLHHSVKLERSIIVVVVLLLLLLFFLTYPFSVIL